MITSTPKLISFLEKHCDTFDGGYIPPVNSKLQVKVSGKYEPIAKVFIMTDYQCRNICMFELVNSNATGKFFTFWYDKPISVRVSRL